MGIFSKGGGPDDVRDALREHGVDCPYDVNCPVIIQPMINPKTGAAELETGVSLHGHVVHPDYE